MGVRELEVTMGVKSTRDIPWGAGGWGVRGGVAWVGRGGRESSRKRGVGLGLWH